MSIDFKQVDFAYDEGQVIKAFTASISQGKFTGILGPNGSGKSTMLKLMLGLLTPKSGHIRLDGTCLEDIPLIDRARQLAYVPQNFQAGFEFTVEEMVAMARYPYLKALAELGPEDQQLVDAALELCAIRDLRRHNVSRISGGEAQRVSIARALAQDTPWILLDEPVNHLDVRHQADIMGRLRDLTPKKSVIAVLHDLNFALRFCDEILLMDQGRLMAQGPPADCLTPQTLKDIYKMDFVLVRGSEGSPLIFPKI